MFEYHMFYVLYPFVTYLLTVPRIKFHRLQRTKKNRRKILDSEVVFSPLKHSSHLL
jgi:hypothetical protein